MIEGEKNEEAAFMIMQLAKLFRISLSKGHTIISIRDELQHAQSYMNIQKIRYKNKFEVVFDIAPEILDYCVVKLVLQPILENAINYGIPDDEIGFLLKDTNRIRKRGSGAQILWSVSKNSESDEIVNLQTQRKVDIYRGGMNNIGFENKKYIYLPYKKVTAGNVTDFIDNIQAVLTGKNISH